MSQQVNPDDFVISRRRKKYKFAKFANANNCFEFEQWDGRHVDVLEVGAGTGFFSLELAKRHPDKIFVALDVKADRMQKGAYAAIEQGVNNVLFVRARADQISELFQPHTVEAIWLTFADPFPRKKSAGRRMSHSNYLNKYAAVLAPSGTFCLKHDNIDFFNWSLEQLVANSWEITKLSFDVHDSNVFDDAKIMTSYEQRWLDEGRITKFVEARRSAS